MITLAIRETCVLLLGLTVSLVCSLFGNAGRDFGALVAAILVPIVFCLVRAGLADLPLEGLRASRRIFAQILFAVSLVSLLLFEMGVAMFAGAADIPADIPAGVWGVVAGFGVAYITLMVYANTCARPTPDVF